MNYEKLARRLASKIPSWFKIKKYDDMRNFCAIEWYEQLLVRKHLFEFIQSRCISKGSDYGANFKFIGGILAAIHENPIVDIQKDRRLAIFQLLSALNYPAHAQGVHSITLRELMQLEENILPERLAYGRQHLKQNHLIPNDYPPKSWLDEPVQSSFILGENTYGVLKINYNLPNRLLIAHFKQHLEKNKSQESGRYRRPEISKWFSTGVLPYMDLKIWSQTTEVNITNGMIGTAIFLNGEGGEDTIRRITKPLVDEIISDKYLERLAAAAMSEKFEE